GRFAVVAARVERVGVAVVAPFDAGLDFAVAAASRLASVEAGVRVRRVRVVTGLEHGAGSRAASRAGADLPVAAAVEAAGGETGSAVAVGGTVVALLGDVDDGVAAGLDPAGSAAAVAVRAIRIVASLDAGPNMAVATRREAATDATVRIAVIAV